MFDVDALIESSGIFATTLPAGQSFKWRLLTLKEYRKLRSIRASGAMHDLFFHNMVFERCYLGDAKLINGSLPSGVFVAIGQLIMWLSGDCAEQSQAQDIDNVRDTYPANSVHEHLKHVILIAFSSYTPDDIESWTRPELLKKFAMAEAVLSKRGSDYQPLDTRKITNSTQAQAKEKIDFAKENHGINKAMSGREHILDQEPAALSDAMARSDQQDRKKARQLDRAMGNTRR
jgi:hypothetical protein